MIGSKTTWAGRILLGTAMSLCMGVAATGCANDTDSTTQAVRPGTDAGNDSGGSDSGSDGGTCGPLERYRTLNTYIGTDFLEIDRLSDTPSPTNPLLFSAADANLVTGNDGDSDSRLFPPANSNHNFVDWSNLAETTDPQHPDPLRNHRVTDGVNRENSIFPRKNDSCIGAGSIGLDKQDLTYIGAANNDDFVYLITQRRDNNGDSGYVWLFTRDAPEELCDGTCNADERLLRYRVHTGDVLVLGEFNPSSPTRLRVFKGAASLPSAGVQLAAYSAINSDDTTLWTEVNTTAVTASNTTTTPATVWGSTNVLAVSNNGNTLLHDIVAEAAVDIRTFIGDSSTCGQQFYGTVISRSSTSTTSDLKDLIGPVIFNFGSINASATITQTCTQQLHLVGSATDQDGGSISNATCSWTIDGVANAATGCNTYFPAMGGLTAGPHTVVLSVTGGSASCSNTGSQTTVNIASPIGVTATASANCSSQLTYNATPSGVSASTVNFAWTWTAPGTTANFTSTVQGEMNRTVSPANTLYSGSVTITEKVARTGFDSACSATNTTSATPYSPLQATLTGATSPVACSSGSSTSTADAITFTLTVTGRDGTYNVSGFPSACNGGMPPSSVTIAMGTGSVTCTIDPTGDNTCADISMQVTVDDTVGVCTDPTTQRLHYQKVSRVCACVYGDTACESRCTLPTL